MRRVKFSIFALTGLFLLTIGASVAQSVKTGNILVDAYYGFPNLYTTVFKTAYANSGSEEGLKIGGVGPLGVRAEYMVADKIGVGLDIGYNNSKVSFVENSYTYDFTTRKIGVMATFNYHFVSNDKIDAYLVFGAGYGNRTFSFKTDDPIWTKQSTTGLIPVASKIGLGFRYFFTEHIGANLAVGFGQGGVINAGVSYKL
jgi:outer membrane protein W